MTGEATGRGNGVVVMHNRCGVLRRLLSFGRKFAANKNEKHSKGLAGEEGATLVEFALASTTLLALLFGTIEVGLAVYSYDFTSEAARDGVRYAIVRGANCHLETSAAGFVCGAQNTDIQSHLQGLGYPGIKSSSITTHTYWYTATVGPPATVWTTLCATDTYSATCAAPGNAVKVVINYPFTLSVPFVPPMTINMGNSSMMTISN